MRGIKTYLRENETSWEEISDEMKLDSSCIKTKCEKLSSRLEHERSVGRNTRLGSPSFLSQIPLTLLSILKIYHFWFEQKCRRYGLTEFSEKQDRILQGVYTVNINVPDLSITTVRKNSEKLA